MSKIRYIVVFESKECEDILPKSTFKEWGSPRFWAGNVRHNADAVYAPNSPKIEQAYRDAGKIVFRPEGEVKVEKPVEKVEPEVEPEVETQSAVEVEATVDSESWRELSWPKMRSLATEFTDEPVKSKEQAKEILEDAEKEGKL